jgi:phosphatidylserine synthase
MNTNQFIVVWYAGLIISTLLCGFAIKEHHTTQLSLLVIAILIITGLVFISFTPNPRIDKRKVALFVSIPAIIGIIIIITLAYPHKNEAPSEQPAVTEPVPSEQPAVTEDHNAQ